MDNHYSKNISSGESESIIPSAYNLYAIDIESATGVVKDIKDLVVGFNFTESIHLPFLEAEFQVKDGANFFEEFGIKGNEKIRVRLSRTAKNLKDREIDLEFYLTQIPEYGRGANNQEQAYVINAISTHAFISSFKRVCRPITSSISNEIKKLFINDLMVDNDKFELIGKSIINFNGILNLNSPLHHVRWLKSSILDNNLYPFFVYQSFYDGKIRLHSLYEMKTAKVYQEYYDKRFSVADTMSNDDYFERVSSILSVNSKLGISQSHIAKNEGFSSRYNFIDFSNKRIIRSDASYSDGTYDENFRINLNKNGVLKSLNEIFVDKEYRSYDKNTHGTDTENYGTSSMRVEQRRKMVLAHYENFVHDIRVNGDTDITPGRLISLNFPKSTDPLIYKQFTGKSPEDFIDKSISGNYIIFSVVHSFEDGKYYCDIRAKKDE